MRATHSSMRQRVAATTAVVALLALLLLTTPPPAAALYIIPSPAAANTNGTPAAVVLHLRRHGLCNRLRSLAAAVMAAADAGVSTLQLHWQREASCNAAVDDLFEVDADGRLAGTQVYLWRDGGEGAAGAAGSTLGADPAIPLTHSQEHASRQAEVLPAAALNNNSSTTDVLLHERNGFLYLPPPLRSISRVVHVTTDTPNIPAHAPCTAFMDGKARFYRSLVPHPAVAAPLAVAAAALATAVGATGRLLGMHVRTYDAGHDYPVVPGRAGKAVFGADDASPLHAFVAAARDMLAGAPPRSVLLVATNDCTGAVVAELAAASPPGVTVVTAASLLQGYTHSDAGVRDTVAALTCDGRRAAAAGQPRSVADARAALLEWLLLSRVDALVGSYWSSFTEEAAVAGRVPLLALAAGGLRAMLPSPDAPLTCGIPPYINRAAAVADSGDAAAVAALRSLSAAPNTTAAAAAFAALPRAVRLGLLAARGDESRTFSLHPCTTPAAAALATTWGLDAAALYCLPE